MMLGFPRPTTQELRALLALALPVITVQVGMMAMGVVDTIMVGHVSAVALAAVALGNVYFFACAIFGMGALMALDPLVAQAVGAGDHDGVTRAVQRGALLAVVLSIPISLCLIPARAIFVVSGQPAEVIPWAAGYARASVPGTLGIFLFIVLRQSLQAMGRMRPIVVTVVLANLLNIFLNWLWIFGHFGFPPLGAIGSAWASSVSRLAMGGMLLWIGWPVLAPHLRRLHPRTFDRLPLWRTLRLGAPIGLQQQLEYSVFGLVGLLMGHLGAVPMAGHQIALNLASITFMVPLGLSTAAAVAVGHAVGRQDQLAARGAAAAAMLCAVLFMGTTAVIFLSLPGPLARFYTVVPPVLAVAMVLIPIAGVFQVFDGIQVTSIGILRGLGDTRTPLVVSLLGYWLLGLPVSLWLGFWLGWGPAGLWWGFVIGLAVVAGILLARVRSRLSAPLRRLELERPVVPGQQRIQVSHPPKTPIDADTASRQLM
jgi:MATE family multidrug resistance protein